MPSVSKDQQTLFRIALSMKRGETPYSYSEAAAKIARSMSMEEIEKYAKGEIKK